MIKTTAMMMEALREYSNPKAKLSRMVRRGECFPIVKGLYETELNVSPHLLAGSIYGPSYISFEFALMHYGLIPETSYSVTCATYKKKKRKIFVTKFGTFTYQDVPPSVFSWEIFIRKDGEYSYWIASAEKALCDRLYTMPPLSNLKELTAALSEDLRIEESSLLRLNQKTVSELSEKYHCTNVKKLSSLLGRMQRCRAR